MIIFFLFSNILFLHNTVRINVSVNATKYLKSDNKKVFFIKNEIINILK